MSESSGTDCASRAEQVAKSSFDSYSSELLEHMPSSSCWLALPTVDSTNRYAQSLVQRLGADFDTVDPFLVLGFEQTAGRGREGRNWQSLAGKGAYQTAVWPLDAPAPAVLQSLPLLVGVATYRAVLAQVEAESLPGRTGLKWPNDLWWGGRKLGGILIEVIPVDGSQRSAALIGVGINHSQRAHEMVDNAVSLQQIDGWRQCGLAELSASFWSCLTALLTRLGDLPGAVDLYRDVVLHEEGDELSWSLGGKILRGSFKGIDDQGRLLLARDGQVERIAAGDVILG